MFNSQIAPDTLIQFEKRIVELFEAGKIPYPIHLSGGNEDQLIEIFKKINSGDYIFSNHRSHYHYILAGGALEKLEKFIREGHSMHIFDKKINFLSSAILAGTTSIAAGVALALQKRRSIKKVWCFLGDGAEDEGHFYESVRFVSGKKLPCTFIIEDNDRSVETPKSERYGDTDMAWPDCVIKYSYKPKYPHVGTGTGKIIDFSGKKIERASF